MKVVINACYGGFSLSPLAVKRLAELRGEPCYFFTQAGLSEHYEPATIESIGDKWIWHAFKVPDPKTLGSADEFHTWPLEERKAYNDRWSAASHDCRPDKRDDPLLVQVVEELGEKANGQCAKLKVVEIPDGIEFCIGEYDGLECVEEVHRSWS